MSGNERIARTEAQEVPPVRLARQEDDTEVVVVGAGPAGLTAAAMLAGYGIRTVVLDRAVGPAPHSRAAVVHARTLETLEPLGIVDEVVRRGVVVPHFGIRDRDRRLLTVPFDELPTQHPYTLMLPQDESERLLRGALPHQGKEILWGHEVTGVRQDASGVDLSVQTPQGEKRVRARFVVGCDGARSSLRQAVGIPFEGGAYPQSFVLADVRMSWHLPDEEVQLFFSPAGLVVVAPLPGGLHRIVATVDDAPAEPSLSEVQALLDARGPRAPRPYVEDVAWSSRFRVQHKVAARFRKEGIFLCGDAAHVHSPAGGQGMNTGIQDAANLAWKLALVLRGQAPISLLDSYERERRPVAQDVVSTTDRLTRLATMRSPLARRLRNVMITIAGHAGRLTRQLAQNFSELDVSYRGGWRVDGARRAERWATTKGHGAIRDLDPAFRLLVPQAQQEQVAADVARFGDLPVRVVAQAYLAQATLLVRPDGYVAGRAAPGQHARLLGLLERVLGA